MAVAALNSTTAIDRANADRARLQQAELDPVLAARAELVKQAQVDAARLQALRVDDQNAADRLQTQRQADRVQAQRAAQQQAEVERSSNRQRIDRVDLSHAARNALRNRVSSGNRV